MKKITDNITLYGSNNSLFHSVEQKLTEYLTKITLPIEVVTIKQSDNTKISYREEEITFNKRSLEKDLQNLYDFLIKINPKTGRICKCSDCNNCPSKRFEKQIDQALNTKV